jgi:hypothetical protein|tara:strand:- start:475 stop:777 length:303 start_codon:yes stop_codon:yes gene_type:complete
MKYNKLIAEFMGGQRVLPDEDVYNMPTHNNLCYGVNELQYDTSWDWLMPVVEKIERQNELIGAHILSTDIDKTYHGVVKFIKEYNKCNKMDTLPPSVQQG